MKIQLSCCCMLGWLLMGSLSAQNAPSAESILENARSEIAILCSPELAGRGYQGLGHQKAAKYLAERFAEIGLQAAGPESYFQPFPLRINLLREGSLSIQDEVLHMGEDFIVDRFSGAGNAEGKIVDLGYGLKPAQFKKARGKIALIRDGWPPALAQDREKKKAYKELARILDRIQQVLPHQPQAVIVVQSKLTAGFTRQALPIPVVNVLADSLSGKIKSAQIAVSGKLETLASQNVIGRIKGSKYPDSVLIISAHYDHLGQMGEAYFPGANDNASGVALLLSLAQHFARPAHRPAYSLLFIAFGGEETGLIGSGYYANQSPLVPLSRTKFILNLDLMGNGIDGIMAVGGVDFPAPYQKLVALNDSLEAVPVVRARKNAPNSDHYFFLENGVPGFFIYTLGGPPHYHDVHDHPGNLELSRYVAIRELLIEFLSTWK